MVTSEKKVQRGVGLPPGYWQVLREIAAMETAKQQRFVSVNELIQFAVEDQWPQVKDA